MLRTATFLMYVYSLGLEWNKMLCNKKWLQAFEQRSSMMKTVFTVLWNKDWEHLSLHRDLLKLTEDAQGLLNQRRREATLNAVNHLY